MPKQRTRLVRAIAMTLTVALAYVLAGPVAAYASAPNPGSVTALALDRSDPNVVTFRLTDNVAVGDCVALFNGVLQIYRPGPSGQTYVVWRESSYTHKTKHYDQFHTDITLQGSDGSYYQVPTSLDGGKMSTALQVYEWSAPSFIFPMTDTFFAHINNVRWTAYC